MIKDLKKYNYWQDNVHKDLEILDVKSSIVGFSSKKTKLSLKKIKEKLEKDELVVSVKEAEGMLEVVAKYQDIETKMEILVNKNTDFVLRNAINDLKIAGSNGGVARGVLKNSFENQNSLASVADFDLQKPLVSYYTQVKVLGNLKEFEFIYDMSSKKFFAKEYFDYINKVTPDALVNNVYTSLITADGWVTTIGLNRLHLKELELNNIKNHNAILSLFKTINTDRLLVGEIVSDILIDYGAGKFFTVLEAEDVVALNLDDSKYVAGAESNRYRQVIIPFKDEKVDLKDITKSIDISAFEEASINFETQQYIINKIRTTRQTFPILFDFMKESTNYQFRVEFENVVGKKKEYIYADVSSLQGEKVEGTMLRDSMHDANLKKGAQVEFTLESVINWEIKLNDNFVITPVNAYMLDVVRNAAKRAQKEAKKKEASKKEEK